MIYRAPSQTKKGKKKENERSVFQLSSVARQCRFHSSKFDLKYGAPAMTRCGLILLGCKSAKMRFLIERKL